MGARAGAGAINNNSGKESGVREQWEVSQGTSRAKGLEAWGSVCGLS